MSMEETEETWLYAQVGLALDVMKTDSDHAVIAGHVCARLAGTTQAIELGLKNL